MAGQEQLDQNGRTISGGVAPASGSSTLPAPQMGPAFVDPITGLTYAAQVAQVIDSAGTNVGGVDAYHNLYVTDGGSHTTQVTASSSAAIKASPGRLCRVIPTTTVTAAATVYDNTSAASGNVLLVIPASAAIGTIYNVQLVTQTGIYFSGAAGSPQVTISWD